MSNDRPPGGAALMRGAEPTGPLGAGLLCGRFSHRGSAAEEYGRLAGADVTLGLFLLAHDAVDGAGLFGQVVALLLLFGVYLMLVLMP